MKRYVLGFAFSLDATKVVLIRKTRPEWQKGRFNGVGGRMEMDETPLQAMEREWREETNSMAPIKWTKFGRLHGPDWEVHLFHAQDDSTCAVFNQGEEGVCFPCMCTTVLERGAHVLPNLRYLIPMAINHITREDRAAYFDIEERA
jgi:8-oxo-dGTP diphosphatase